MSGPQAQNIPNTNTAGLVYTSIGNGTNRGVWLPATSLSNVNATEIQGVPVSSTSPSTGQALVYNGTKWAPATPSANATQIQGVPIVITSLASGQVLTYNGTDWVNSQVNAASIDGVLVSGTPSSGQVIVATSSSAADWQTLNNVPIGGVPIVITSLASGQVLTYNGTDWVNSQVNAASIDGVTVSGTPSSGQFIVATSSTTATWQSVTLGNATQIQGVPITITSLASGQFLEYNGTAWVNSAVSAISGVVVSGTPSVGQVLTATSSSAADWQTVSSNATQIQGVNITITSLASGQALVYNGTAWVNSTVNANSIDGVVVSGTPSSGQVLTATSSSAANWQTLPSSAANNVFGTSSVGGSIAVSSSAFTALETISVTGYTKYAIFFNFGQSAAATAAAQVNVRIQDTTASATAWGSNGVGQVTATTTDRASFSGSCSYTAPSTATRTLSLQVELGSGSSSMSFGNLTVIGVA